MTRVCHQNVRECEMSKQLSLLELLLVKTLVKVRLVVQDDSETTPPSPVRSMKGLECDKVQSAELQDTLHSPVSPSVMAVCQVPQTSHSTSVSSDKEIDSVLNAFNIVLPLGAAFPTLNSLLQIALTTVVSSAQCERSFLALKKLLANYNVRTTTN